MPAGHVGAFTVTVNWLLTVPLMSSVSDVMAQGVRSMYASRPAAFGRPPVPSGRNPRGLPVCDQRPQDGKPGNTPQVVEFFDVARAGSLGPRLEEIEVTERSALAGWRLQDLSGSAVPLLVHLMSDFQCARRQSHADS